MAREEENKGKWSRKGTWKEIDENDCCSWKIVRENSVYLS